MRFRISGRTTATTRWSWRDGILNGPVRGDGPDRRAAAPDGVMERTAIGIRRVGLLERGAYATARVAAVRSAPEGAMHTCNDCGAELVPGVAHICPTRARRPAAGTRSRAAAAATAAPADDDGEADDGEDDAEDAPAPADGTRRAHPRDRGRGARGRRTVGSWPRGPVVRAVRLDTRGSRLRPGQRPVVLWRRVPGVRAQRGLGRGSRPARPALPPPGGYRRCDQRVVGIAGCSARPRSWSAPATC
jgi:hypothetical protein